MTENYKDMSLPPSWNEMLTEEAARNTRKREDGYCEVCDKYIADPSRAVAQIVTGIGFAVDCCMGHHDKTDDAEAGDYCRDIVEAEQTFADKAKTAPRRGGVTNK